jgi:hypothetical protein
LPASNAPTNQKSGGPELESKATDADDSKYIVKNKDTGEVFDIRDLASMPANSYSIFPNNFVAPQEEEVCSAGGVKCCGGAPDDGSSSDLCTGQTDQD